MSEICVGVFDAGDDQAQFFTLRTVKTLAMTALDVLLDPELLQKVKQEFTEAKLKEDRKLTREHTEQAAKKKKKKNHYVDEWFLNQGFVESGIFILKYIILN